MAPVALRSSISASKRGFSTSSSSRASILFALGALSNSRETQHFNKISRLERTEHSPNLKLIKSSEVDPFPCPLPAKPVIEVAPWSKQRTVAVDVSQPRPFTRGESKIWNDKALAAGRAILSDVARERSQMRRILERTRRREEKQNLVMKKELEAFAEERRKMRNEMRAAGAWILVSVAAATSLAMYVFWPPASKIQDSGEMGRRIAARAKAAIPLPPAVSKPVGVAASNPAETVAGLGAVPATAVVTGEPTVAATMVVKEEVKATTAANGWSWKNLLWKKD